MVNDEAIVELIDLKINEVKELIKKLEEDQTRIKTLHGNYLALTAAVSRLTQAVKEYKLWKDPNNTKEKIRLIQNELSRLNIMATNTMVKMQQFESKQWLRILTDEELIEQYERAGKPSMKDIAAEFNTSVENAYNYTKANIKDAKIRWAFFRFCGGA